MRDAEQIFTYWHMEWHPRTNLHGENRTAILNLELPHATLFRILATPGNDFQRRAAGYFIAASEANFEDVLHYLRSFFSQLEAHCEPHFDMKIRPEFRGSEFDFPRPSPTWMMVEMFCNALRIQRQLCERPWLDGRRCF